VCPSKQCCFVILTWGCRRITNKAFSCPGIFSRTLRFYYVARSPSSPLPHLPDGHRKLAESRVQQGVGCFVLLTWERRRLETRPLVRGWKEAKQEKNKKKKIVPKPKRLGWYRRLRGPICDKLWSTMTAIFPCVALPWYDCSLLRIIAEYCQTRKRPSVWIQAQLLSAFGHLAFSECSPSLWHRLGDILYQELYNPWFASIPSLHLSWDLSSPELFAGFFPFLSWVAKPQLKHWTKSGWCASN